MKISNLKTQSSKLKREFSAGGVVFKRSKINPAVAGQKSKIWFLLGKHSGYHKWVLPKGLIEEGEKSWQTAVRETEEEMGVKVRLVQDKPIHKETYFYWADLKNLKSQISNFKTTTQNSKVNRGTRRVINYQEQGGGKTRVFKTVTFYLLEYVSGDPREHGWEMSEVDWFESEEALKLMGFVGEKEALRKAAEIVRLTP